MGTLMRQPDLVGRASVAITLARIAAFSSLSMPSSMSPGLPASSHSWRSLVRLWASTLPGLWHEAIPADPGDNEPAGNRIVSFELSEFRKIRWHTDAIIIKRRRYKIGLL